MKEMKGWASGSTEPPRLPVSSQDGWRNKVAKTSESKYCDIKVAVKSTFKQALPRRGSAGRKRGFWKLFQTPSL